MTVPAHGTVSSQRKPTLPLGAIANLSFGFLGIQIAFGLQTANVSRIFQILGASIDSLPILWIAGPVTGLLVQPVIGYLSDRTWGRLGRRRPYFLLGAILSTIALVLLPNSTVLWVAVPSFWLLDLALNVTMEPFRAFVGDMLPDEQRTRGYAIQTIFIGVGASLSSAAPWLLSHLFGLADSAPPGQLPLTVRLSFYIGAAALLLAVLYTIATTREYSPQQLAEFEGVADPTAADRSVHPISPVAASAPPRQRFQAVRELFSDLVDMPKPMRRLALVQFFSWFGFFLLWIYGTPSVAWHHFGATVAGSSAYNTAADHVGVLFALYNVVATVHAFLLPSLAARVGRERLHALNLLAGALGFATFLTSHDADVLYLAMVGIGMAWASVLAMPYAMLCGAIPYQKLGTYMGIFNFFIVLPQIVVSVVMGSVVHRLFPGDPVGAMGLAALAFLTAAALAWKPLQS
jgi:maltose/moltooligosaccharide transporter